MKLGLINSLSFSGGIGGLDPDAKAYILAVEAADGQTLESGVKKAYNTFVKGCKSDGIWNAIKASCILSGARTLSGALVPLKGTAPTNFNFVSGDYARRTGLKGNGTTKYLDSNRNNNADPQNNSHNAFYCSSSPTTGITTTFMGVGLSAAAVGKNDLVQSAIDRNLITRSRQQTSATISNNTQITGLVGMSRSNSSSYTVRLLASNATLSTTSETPFNGNVFIFARNANTFSDTRLSFYSIGESVDLEKLDSRVTSLMSNIATAIP
jgi:hypothetical protein